MFDKIKKLFIVEDDDPLKKALEQKSQEEAEAMASTEEIVPSRPASKATFPQNPSHQVEK